MRNSWRTRALILLSLLVTPLASAAPGTLSLKEYLSQVRAGSPDLASERASIEAAEARAAGIRIPAPMVGYMMMKEGSSSRNGFEVSQEIPFPTKILKEESARDLEERAEKEASTVRSSEVLANARLAFVKFWTTHERLRILKQREDWLKKHVRFSRSTVRSDTGVQLHLLDMQSEADLAGNEILVAEADLAEARNRLKVFAPNFDLKGRAPSLPAPVDVGSLEGLPNQIVAAKAADLASKDSWAGYAKQSYLPNLFVRYQSFGANEMSPKSQEIMAGVTVPFLFFWQPKAEVAEARAESIRAEASLHKARVETESMLDTLRKRASALSQQISIYESKVIPRAERGTRLLRNVSLRSMEGLNQHREVMLGFLDLKLKALALREEYEGVISQISTITGLNPALEGK